MADPIGQQDGIAMFVVANYADRTRARGLFLQKILPFLVFLVALAAWEAVVRINKIPHYILPAPSLVARAGCSAESC